MQRPVPELRPATWLTTAPADVDWRDAGGGLVGVVSLPGYGVESAARVLMERHIASGTLHLTARSAAAVTGAEDADLRRGIQIGSPATSPTGWLAALSPLLEIDGHLRKLFGERPVYFPASVEHLLALPGDSDLTRAYLWAARTWRAAANPVTPLALALGEDRLTVHAPEEGRADHPTHRAAVLLAAGQRRPDSNYHGAGDRSDRSRVPAR
ncbi:hypothetical protein ACFORJ_05745 [Corynebacterium hansenii]|uniref:Uncharacterized protein n=1 Tax=Corynebacterium hansenii TaxID=394964 RepID=A0ABV7ZPF3_9CORY|nr:hypothetical protein [Corynebacterium hansenii]WJZ00246.1 hypothetical protein CHAN_08185 [Corynebacterium hansenii]